MSGGWGQDFDEDGNVIGEMPDGHDDPAFHEAYKTKIVLVAGLLFLLNLNDAAALGPGGLVGSLAGSLAVGALLVYVGVGIRKRI